MVNHRHCVWVGPVFGPVVTMAEGLWWNRNQRTPVLDPVGSVFRGLLPIQADALGRWGTQPPSHSAWAIDGPGDHGAGRHMRGTGGGIRPPRSAAKSVASADLKTKAPLPTCTLLKGVACWSPSFGALRVSSNHSLWVAGAGGFNDDMCRSLRQCRTDLSEPHTTTAGHGSRQLESWCVRRAMGRAIGVSLLHELIPKTTA